MKTSLTKRIELELYSFVNAAGNGVYGAYEVCYGPGYGNEYCDFVTYSSKGEIRCYEIKISKQDFHSSNKLTFRGHYNYFVIPAPLYPEIKNEIPYQVGVIIYYDNDNPKLRAFEIKKKATKQTIYIYQVVETLHCMVRSLSRLTTKFVNTEKEKYNKLLNEYQ